MRNWLKENWFKLSFLFAIILVALSICYYYLFFLPNNKEEVIKNKLLAGEILNDCLVQADWQHLSIFERISRVSNPKNWENIPVQISYRNVTGDTDSERKENLKLWQDARDDCFRLYNK